MRSRRSSGLDPIEVRRRNLIAAAEMPFRRPLDTLGTEIVLDSGDYAAAARQGARSDRLGSAAGSGSRRAARAGELVGAGLAMFVEKSGLGPFDQVHVTVDTTGAVEVVTGAASVGQGVETVDRADLRRDARASTIRRSASSTARPTASPTASAPSRRA